MVLVKSLVLAALASLAAANSAVLDLTASNFDEVVLAGKPTLVEFFAPWCGHCKNLAPTYEELGAAFVHSDKIQIAKVDADSERELGKRFGVQGFPTLKYFDGKSDKPEDYDSGRDLDSLVSFMTEKTGVRSKKKAEAPSNVEFLTDASFATTVGGDKHVLVAFTAPWCGHCKSLAPTWETLAADFANDENVVIAKVDAEAENSKATAGAQGVTSYPTIFFFAAGNKEGAKYEGGRSEQDLLNFINEKTGTHRLPGGELNDDAGTVASLDAIVAQFVSGTPLAKATAEASAVIAKIEEAAHQKFAKYYIRVFEKLSKDEEWVAKESTRLTNILAKGGLAPFKRDEIKQKFNVLVKFSPKSEEAAHERDEL